MPEWFYQTIIGFFSLVIVSLITVLYKNLALRVLSLEKRFSEMSTSLTVIQQQSAQISKEVNLILRFIARKTEFELLHRATEGEEKV